MPTTETTRVVVDVLLSAVRLGDADRLGWWRSHSVDQVAEYALGGAFPSTWMATGLELAMESARLRHELALERPTAIHMFSDYLPFHQLLRAWLIERKLERDTGPLAWLPPASVEDLRTRLGPATAGERRGAGLYLGDVTREELDDESRTEQVLGRLAAAYAGLDGEFAAPYLDLT